MLREQWKKVTTDGPIVWNIGGLLIYVFLSVSHILRTLFPFHSLISQTWIKNVSAWGPHMTALVLFQWQVPEVSPCVQKRLLSFVFIFLWKVNLQVMVKEICWKAKAAAGPDVGAELQWWPNQMAAPGASSLVTLCLPVLRWCVHARNVKMTYKLSKPALILIITREPVREGKALWNVFFEEKNNKARSSISMLWI